MSWVEAVQYVGSPLALVAFVVAIVASLLRSRMVERRRTIESAPAEDRARFAEVVFRDFRVVPTDDLTRLQRFELAGRLVDQKLARYRLAMGASALVAVLLAVLIAFLAVLDARAEGSSLAVRLTTPPESPFGAGELAGEVTLETGLLHLGRPVVDGVARFDGLPSGVLDLPAVLTPHVRGFRETALRLPRLPAERVVELRLELLSTEVCGRVVEKEAPERVVAGATVRIGRVTALTDEQGGFCVTVPSPPGTVEPVSVLANGVLGHRSDETIAPGSELLLTFRKGAAP